MERANKRKEEDEGDGEDVEMKGGKEEKMKVVLIGAVGEDMITVLPSYPAPDQKVRAEKLEYCGGGGAGNVAVTLSRLSPPSFLDILLVSSVGEDERGRRITTELEREGVITTYLHQRKGEESSFTYVITERGNSTRTCIHHPLTSPLSSSDLPLLLQRLKEEEGVKVVYMDSRHWEVAVGVGEWSREEWKEVEVWVDIEKVRDGYLSLLSLSSFLHSEVEDDILYAGIRVLEEHKERMKWITITMGKEGSLLLFPFPSFPISFPFLSISSFSDLSPFLYPPDRNNINNNINNNNNIDNNKNKNNIDNIDIGHNKVKNNNEEISKERWRKYKEEIKRKGWKEYKEKMVNRGWFVYEVPMGKRKGRRYMGCYCSISSIIDQSDVMDTTGCGDAFLGASLFFFLSFLSIPSSLSSPSSSLSLSSSSPSQRGGIEIDEENIEWLGGMMEMASIASALKTTSLGSRSSLPSLSLLLPFLSFLPPLSSS